MGPYEEVDGRMVMTDPMCPYCGEPCKIDGRLEGPPIAIPWDGKGLYKDEIQYDTDGD